MPRLVTAMLGLVLTAALLPGVEPPRQIALGRISQDLPGPMDTGLSLSFANGVLRREPGAHEVVIEGRDFDDKPWRVRMPTVEGIGVSMGFSAHLDGGPLPDLFVLHSYAESGMCSSLGLSAILFDKRGKPTPWYSRAPFDGDGDRLWKEGVRDWADWDGDGGVELILPECYNYEYNTATSPYPQGAFGLRAVYEADHGYWRKLGTNERKPFESSYLEVLVRGHRPIAPRPEKPFSPQPPDLSNDPSKGRRIKSFAVVRGGRAPSPLLAIKYKTLESRRTGEHHIKIGPNEFCYGAPMVVVDREQGREVLFDGGSDYAWQVLTEISSGEFDVVLTGQNEEGVCSPAIIWAFQR